jgi:hypothetical protein
MAIKYEKIDSFRRGDGWTVEQIKIIVDDFDPPKEKIVSLDNYDNHPGTLEKNLAIQTDEFIKEIKDNENIKNIDITASLDKVAISVNEKHKDAFKVGG